MNDHETCVVPHDRANCHAAVIERVVAMLEQRAFVPKS